MVCGHRLGLVGIPSGASSLEKRGHKYVNILGTESLAEQCMSLSLSLASYRIILYSNVYCYTHPSIVENRRIHTRGKSELRFFI
jgi:hypothetical protein